LLYRSLTRILASASCLGVEISPTARRFFAAEEKKPLVLSAAALIPIAARCFINIAPPPKSGERSDPRIRELLASPTTSCPRAAGTGTAHLGDRGGRARYAASVWPAVIASTGDHPDAASSGRLRHLGASAIERRGALLDLYFKNPRIAGRRTIIANAPQALMLVADAR